MAKLERALISVSDKTGIVGVCQGITAFRDGNRFYGRDFQVVKR